MSLVCVLTFLVISNSLALQEPCKTCPPGYYRKSSCGLGENVKCEKCPDGYYMDKENTEKTCIDCMRCGINMVMVKECTSVANRQCVKKDEDKRPELPKIVDCNPLCKVITTKSPHISTNTATIATTTTTTTTMTRGSNVTTTKVPPALNPLVWVLLLVVMLPLTCCVCLLFMTNLYKYVHLCCSCWRDKQHMEAPLQTDAERGCLQSPTTLDFTFYEETPMMEVMSPVPPEIPAHSAPQLPEVEHSALSDQTKWEPFPAIVLYAVIKEVPLRRWKELMRLLSVADQQLERVELDVGLSSMERQYQQLRLWSQKSEAKIDDIYSALHYMELTGCAHMIRESLDQIRLRSQGGVV